MSETPTAVPEPGAPDAAVTRQTRRRIIPSPHRGRPRPLRRLSRALRVLGPGLITGAADDDPSGIGTYSQAGAAFGTGLLWLALYLLPLAIAVQEMCGRIGLVTNKGIAGVLRECYSRPLLYHRGGAALHCQHHQRRRGPWRDGGERTDARARDSVHPDPGDLRRRHPAARDLHPLSSLRAHPEAADTLAGWRTSSPRSSSSQTGARCCWRPSCRRYSSRQPISRSSSR